MTPPTEREFRIARDLSNQNDEVGENAYQVCRWFRGQMFLREPAEKELARIRRSILEALQ